MKPRRPEPFGKNHVQDLNDIPALFSSLGSLQMSSSSRVGSAMEESRLACSCCTCIEEVADDPRVSEVLTPVLAQPAHHALNV